VAVRVAAARRQFEDGFPALGQEGWLDVHRLALAKAQH